MLDQALTLLHKKDSASICEGARQLAKLGRPEGITPLLELLRTRDEAARACVKDALAQLDVVPVLLADWRSGDDQTKDRALDRAVALPHPGLMEIYHEAATDPDAGRRRRVATGLRHQAESAVTTKLLEALVADADNDVRWWAIDTLGLSTSPEAARILRARLPHEPDAALQVFIRRALGE